MKTAILATIVVLAIAPLAHADYISDQLAKAEKRVASAEKNLLKWRDCEANRDTCLAELKAAAEKSVANAQKRLASFN